MSLSPQVKLDNKPSRVVHIRNIPNDVSETEVIHLGMPFGKVTNVLVLKGKNQVGLRRWAVVSGPGRRRHFWRARCVTDAARLGRMRRVSDRCGSSRSVVPSQRARRWEGRDGKERKRSRSGEKEPGPKLVSSRFFSRFFFCRARGSAELGVFSAGVEWVTER